MKKFGLIEKSNIRQLMALSPQLSFEYQQIMQLLCDTP